MASETTDTFATANKTYFDNIAHKYDDMPHAVERARRSVEVMRNAYAFEEDKTTILEYACGTGLVSRELAPYSKRIVGVDISQGMVDRYNERVGNQGIPPEEMQAFCIELKGEPGELNDEKFDVVVCTAAYHHFTDIDGVTKILAYFLKPGGTLLVIDICKGNLHRWHTEHVHEQSSGHIHEHPKSHNGGHGHGDHGHGHTHTADPLFPQEVHHVVPHKHGLDESDMQKAFESAGLESFSFEDVFDVKKNGEDAKLFIARGTKSIA